MAVLRGGVELQVVVAVLAFAALVMIPEVFSDKITVGGKKGWTTNFNYTIWAEGRHFYLGDWLFFVYDRNQGDVLEVNKTDYENCNAAHPLHNWTGGAGRDVAPLNVTRAYYYITGKGFCYGGMKLAVNVENPPPPPVSAPPNEKSEAPRSTYRSQFVVPAVFAVAALWDSFLRVLW
ncbi:early nodulin-like protein 17 [Malania oleifera]|uniref:early nodulin-like protein 17 n=1 Tax=Malania oleifera TaxID=397392 RepID=UPI0025ADA1F2|nr:early nodulin-like protein 17 [Malania oleifera]